MRGSMLDVDYDMIRTAPARNERYGAETFCPAGGVA